MAKAHAVSVEPRVPVAAPQTRAVTTQRVVIRTPAAPAINVPSTADDEAPAIPQPPVRVSPQSEQPAVHVNTTVNATANTAANSAAPAPPTAAPVPAEPVAKKGERQEAKAQPVENHPAPPATAVAVPQPVEIRPAPARVPDGTATPAQTKASAAVASGQGDEAAGASQRPAALEVTLHFDDQAAANEPAAPASQIQSISLSAAVPAVFQPAQPHPVSTGEATSPAAVTSAPSTTQPLPARTTLNEPPVARMGLTETRPPDVPKTTPTLRSVALEFTPDGAQDIRLRLTEHAGDVHISLHAADPSLAGKLSEGVHDLVGSLSQAGYDAQAWTPDQGRRQQQPPEQQPETRRGPQGEAADFSAVIDESKKENA